MATAIAPTMNRIFNACIGRASIVGPFLTSFAREYWLSIYKPGACLESRHGYQPAHNAAKGVMPRPPVSLWLSCFPGRLIQPTKETSRRAAGGRMREPFH